MTGWDYEGRVVEHLMAADAEIAALKAERGVPVEQLRAAVLLLGPQEMTPTAKRVLLSICDQHDPKAEDG